MFTVAVIGPDGVGKTTISRRLEKSLAPRSKYVYMGVNVDASNVALPTSRWLRSARRALGKADDHGGPLEHQRANESPSGGIRRVLTSVKRVVRLLNQTAEESYRQLVVATYLLRGYIVLTDRDFFADFYAYDIAEDATKSFTRRIHGFLLKHFYRRPDLFIFLDADPHTMYARKGEGTPELLEQRRQDYLALADVVDHFKVIDANRDLPEVIADVETAIRQFASNRRQTPASIHPTLTAEQRKGIS